tara:strand:+ start:380 stop:829 length:450 start_codon:yes stop_codon:yes gene_type:complete
MGTRSLTYIQDSWETAVADEENNNEVHKTTENIICMYRQFDGYLDGHGRDLAEFLEDFNIVNGMRLDDPPRTANGMDCLAAQLIAHFKDGPGNIYMYHSDSKDCGEEYRYTIYENNKELFIRAYSVWEEKIVFDGTPVQLIKKLETQKV